MPSSSPYYRAQLRILGVLFEITCVSVCVCVPYFLSCRHLLVAIVDPTIAIVDLLVACESLKCNVLIVCFLCTDV